MMINRFIQNRPLPAKAVVVAVRSRGRRVREELFVLNLPFAIGKSHEEAEPKERRHLLTASRY
jgi:hypothetical protein